jgi:hypothetical protein
MNTHSTTGAERPALRIRIPPIDETVFAQVEEEGEDEYVCCRECGDEAPPTYWGDFCSRSCYIVWWSVE